MYSQEISKKFQRRKDLTVEIRIRIAYIVLYAFHWGDITRLSHKYNVSRQFIYELCEDFSKFNQFYFGDKQNTDNQNDKICSLKFILANRMEGRCSIPSISLLGQRFGLQHYSVGYISETLSDAGHKIGNNLNTSNLDCFTFQICDDEIFAAQKPILLTVDPISMLILNIELAENRKHDTWINHWQHIIKQGITFEKIIKDEGTGMNLAIKKMDEMSNVEVQSDTFHGVSHKLGLWVTRLETSAYKAIENEYDREELFYHSKTEATQNKREAEYNEAFLKTLKKIELYENFKFLYHCLLECLQVFDNKGKLKDYQKVIADFDQALEYIKTLKNNSISKEIESIEKCKKDLFCFLKSAKSIVYKLSQTIDNKPLKLLCLAWQYHKNMIKAKNAKRKNKLKKMEEKILQHAKELINKDFDAIKEDTYDNLNHIIQSSAAVENINSLLRPYLNSCKNQVTQEFLNLFMFYHNHHRFTSGERKGKTPMEIAIGIPQQKDWLDLLIEKISVN